MDSSPTPAGGPGDDRNNATGTNQVPAFSGGTTPSSQPAVNINTSAVPSESAEDRMGATGAGFLTSHPQRSVASGTGDIILHNGPATDDKKKWIILGIATAVVIAIVTVIMIVAGRGGDKATTGVEANFNRYANYLLYGEDKTASLDGEYDEERSYELNLQLESDTYDEEYWQTARDLLDSAIESYNNSESSSLDIAEYFGNYQDTFTFVNLYKQTGDPALDEGGANILGQAELNKAYAAFLDSGNSSAVAYAESRIAQYAAWSELYTFYDSLGCVNSGVVDETCAANADETHTETVDAMMEKMVEANRAADGLLSNAVYTLVSDCWYFGEVIREGAADNAEEEDELEADDVDGEEIMDEDLGNETVFDYDDEEDTYDEATYNGNFSDAWPGNLDEDDDE